MENNLQNKIITNALKGYFIAVAVLMYYFLTETINLGLFITYRHVFALVLFASAFVCFLVKPNVARAVAGLKATFVYSLPLIITILVSLFIWFVGQVDTSIISRGLSSSFIYNNMISFTLAAVAFLYIFGEKGLWYNLIAILIANMLMLLTIILQNGIGVFFSEFVTLIITFAGETGDVIVQAEIHELAFCLGAYLIYMLLKPKRNFVFYILLVLAGFCFVAAFKRIGIIAIAVALGVGWILRMVAKFNDSTAKNLATILSLVIVAILIGYIFIIKLDVFTMLEEIGIETSGRVEIYDTVDKFYEFSPEFLGNGIGFLTYQLSGDTTVAVASVHNDFLQYFIDLGFWGYVLWLISIIAVRVRYFGKKGGTDTAIITLALTVYFVISSSTDNTMNYPLLTTVLAIIMIGQGFDENVRKTEEKMFGHISDANKLVEGDSIL